MQTILKKIENFNFTSISNELLQDTNLSFEAKGLACYLLSKPSNWDINTQAIVNEGNIGRDRCERFFKELIKAGYMYKSQQRTNGRFGKAVIFISSSKETLNREVIEKENSTVGLNSVNGGKTKDNTSSSKQATSNTSSASKGSFFTSNLKPFTEKPLTVNTEQQTKELTNKRNKENKKTTTNITVNKIDLPAKQEETKSSSSSGEVSKQENLVKDLLTSHGLDHATISNILKLKPSLDRIKTVLQYAVAKKLQAGAIYNAIKENWSTTLPGAKAPISLLTPAQVKKKICDRFDYWASYYDNSRNSALVLDGFAKDMERYSDYPELVEKYKTKLNHFIQNN